MQLPICRFSLLNADVILADLEDVPLPAGKQSTTQEGTVLQQMLQIGGFLSHSQYPPFYRFRHGLRR